MVPIVAKINTINIDYNCDLVIAIYIKNKKMKKEFIYPKINKQKIIINCLKLFLFIIFRLSSSYFCSSLAS